MAWLDISRISLVENFSSDFSAWVLAVSRTFFVFAVSSQDCSIEASEGLSKSSMLVNSRDQRHQLSGRSIDFFLHRTFWSVYRTGKFFSSYRSGHRRSILSEGS